MEYIRVSELANLLGVTKEAIYLRIRNGSIKSEKVAGYHVIPKIEVDRWQKIKTLTLTRLERAKNGDNQT